MVNNSLEVAYVSADLSKEGITEMYTWKVRYLGRDIMHVEVDVPHVRENPVFGLSWATDTPTQKGLDAIRLSYGRLKKDYREIRELLGIDKSGPFVVGDVTYEISYDKKDFFPLLVSASLSDSEHSESETSSRTVAMNLEDFLNPDSLSEKSSPAQNPLLWIRVDTEYLSYYFQEEQKEGERMCGVTDGHVVADEIVKFYQDTAQIILPDNYLDKLQKVLEELVKDYPKYDRR